MMPEWNYLFIFVFVLKITAAILAVVIFNTDVINP
jgi:hypothetical protein